MHFSWEVLFEFRRSPADDLGGSFAISPYTDTGNAQNSNLLFSKVGLVQSLSNLSPAFLRLDVLNPVQIQQLEKAVTLAKNKNVEILIHVVQ